MLQLKPNNLCINMNQVLRLSKTRNYLDFYVRVPSLTSYLAGIRSPERILEAGGGGWPEGMLWEGVRACVWKMSDRAREKKIGEKLGENEISAKTVSFLRLLFDTLKIWKFEFILYYIFLFILKFMCRRAGCAAHTYSH